MPVQVQQEQIDHSRVALTIEVPPEEYQKAVDNVFSQFAKRTSIPGFRPGKAPRQLLKRVIDEEQVRELALERAMTNAFREAIRQSGVHPYSEAQPEVEMQEEELDPEKGFSFKATIALEPHVHLGSLEGLQGRLIKTAITEEDVTRELDRYREAVAEYAPTDQPAEEGDRIRATASVSIDGQPVEDLTFNEPTLFQVGSNLEGFDAGLKGMTVEEAKTFDFTFPEEMEDEDLAGKQATATVDPIEVLRRTAPELDDDFAQKVGFDTVDALKERVRENLQAQADAMAEQEMMDELIQEVVRRSEVHFPEELVEHEVTHRVNNLIAALEKRGFTLEQYLAAEKTDLAKFQAQTREDAVEALNNTLVLLDIARQNNIRVTDKDVEAEVKRRAEEENVKVSQMRRLLSDTGEIENIQNRIFRYKVAQFLKDKAEVRELEG